MITSRPTPRSTPHPRPHGKVWAAALCGLAILLGSGPRGLIPGAAARADEPRIHLTDGRVITLRQLQEMLRRGEQVQIIYPAGPSKEGTSSNTQQPSAASPTNTDNTPSSIDGQVARLTDLLEENPNNTGLRRLFDQLGPAERAEVIRRYAKTDNMDDALRILEERLERAIGNARNTKAEPYAVLYYHAVKDLRETATGRSYQTVLLIKWLDVEGETLCSGKKKFIYNMLANMNIRTEQDLRAIDAHKHAKFLQWYRKTLGDPPPFDVVGRLLALNYGPSWSK